MRHFGKRAFALILALMLCLSLFPSALAEDAGSIAAADEPEQEGTIAPAEEGSIRPAEEGDALPRADEAQDGATSGQCGDELSWSFDESSGTLTITGSGDMWDWSYNPSAPWYSLRASIKSVEFPRGLTGIGDYAFYYCSKLASVDIPAGVTSIGNDAFSGCSGLTSLVIPGSIQTIERWAFRSCSGLTSVVIREGVECIMDSAFASCSKLSSVTLPGSLTFFGSDVFYSCSELQEVYFGGTVEAWNALQISYNRTKITVHCADGDLNPTDPAYCGDDLTWSFDETTGTLSITGSGDMWDWSYPAFAPWYSLRDSIKSVELPRGLTSVGRLAFCDCIGLTKVDIPAGVTSIGSAAFSDCSGLTKVDIPEGVTSIGGSAFARCSALTDVTIPNTVRLIDEYAFSNCSALTSVVIPGSVKTVSSNAFSFCSGLTSVVVREGTESIMDQAFQYCSKLSSVTLPGSLSYLGGIVFNSCSELQEVYFGGTMEAWKALQVSYDRTKITVHCADGDLLPAAAEQCGDNLTWSFDETTGTLTITGNGDMWDWRSSADVPWVSLRASIKSVALPRGLTSIGSYAFYGCSGLTSVTIPVGVTSIGSWAFSGCSGLTDVTIPGSVTSIGARAFQGCSGLTDVTIPEGVVIIWGAIFYNCSRLTSLTIPASATEINTYLLSDCQNLKDVYYAGTCEAWRGLNLVYDRGSVTVHCADGTIETYIAGDRQCGDNLFWSLENGVLTISGTGDMWNFESYRESPDSYYKYLSTAPWYPQRDMITQIRLSEGVTSIGNYAFSARTSPIYFTGSTCDNVVSVELPETLQRIGISGLADCSSLKEIRLPNSLREIGDGALAHCGFTELALPEGLETIGSYAFYSAEIRSLTVPASVTQIGSNAFQNSFLSEIRFLGNAPAIDGTAFHGKTATAYYPQNNPTWTESVKRSYGGVITWEPYLPTESTLSLGDATACAGKAFTVDLTLDENPGVMGLSFQLDYDSSVMEFVGAEDGVLTGWTVNAKKNILVWDDDREHTDTGCLLKLKFRLKEDAAPGETRIGITDLDVGNYNEDSLYFQVRSGRVTVLVHRPGDANGDGKVNVNDLIRLQKYLVDVEKEIIEGNADVNADEIVDILDLVRLRKYIAQMEGVILE